MGLLEDTTSKHSGNLVREISAKTLRIALKSRILYKPLHSAGEERFLKFRKITEAQVTKQVEEAKHESCEATYLVARPDRLHTSEPIGTSIEAPITPDNDTVSNGFGRSIRRKRNNCIEIQPFNTKTGLQEDSGHVNPEPPFETISETNVQLEECAYGDAQMSDLTIRQAEDHLLNAEDHRVFENTIDEKQEKEPAAVDIVEEMPTKAKAALEDLIIGEENTDSPILEETFYKNSETSHESIEPTASNPLDFADRNESVSEPPVLLDFLMDILDPNEETAESPAPEESVGGSSQKQIAPTPSNRNKTVKCHFDKSVKLTGGPYEVSGRPTQKIRASKTRTLNYLLIFTKWSNSDYIYFYNRLKKTTQVFPLNTQFALKDYSVEFVNGEVYLFGGITPAGKLVKTTYKLNRALEWGKVKNMRHPRANFGSIAFDGKIWIFGGSNENCPMLDLVERYDPMLDEWTKVKSMHHARSNPAVTVVFGKIYVCGGNQTRVDLQENIELWDPVNELWTVFYRSMPPTQGDVYAHSAGCHLYITSEKREKATFWKIDVTASSSQWEETHAEKKKDILFIARTGVRESKVFGNVFLPQKWADGLGVRSFEGFKSVELQEGLLLDAIKANPWISNVSEPFTTSRILLLGGISGSERCDKIYLLNKECTSWRRLPFHLPSALSYHSAVYLEDKLYVFTGDVHGFAEDLFCLDNKNWEKKTSLLQKRRGISNSSVVFEKTIVVIGGEDKSGNALSTVERYDPSNNNCMWIDMPKLNIARKEAAATVVLGKIMVCGGKTSEGELLSSVELYEPSSSSWALIRCLSMPPPTSSYSLSSIGSTVIAIGGDSSTKVWTLNMNSRPQETWRSVAPLEMPSWNGCAIKFDRFKILAAGYGTKITKVFNGHNWTKGPKLPEEFYGMAVTISEDLATVLSTLIIFPIT